MSAKMDVRDVFTTSGRAVALVADGCAGLRKAQWESHLKAHDAAMAALAELIGAAGYYFTHYCQDEADDWCDEGEDTGEETGCAREQIVAAKRLRAAVANVGGAK